MQEEKLPTPAKDTTKLLLVRDKQGKNTTLSSLYLVENGETTFLCYILEDVVRGEKIPKVTAIPTGTFPLRFRTEGGLHNKYKKLFPDFHIGMIEIFNLVTFLYVMFHIGNTKEDTEGCPLVGEKYRFVNGDYKVTKSTITYKKVYPKIANLMKMGKLKTITIVNSPTIVVF